MNYSLSELIVIINKHKVRIPKTKVKKPGFQNGALQHDIDIKLKRITRIATKSTYLFISFSANLRLISIFILLNL